MLLAYAVGAFGLLPSPRTVARGMGKALGERFPCEACGCGCASARECWTHCCCRTDQQRLIWALTQGVMPPDSCEATDEQWLAAAVAVRADTALGPASVPRIKAALARGEPLEPEPAAENAGACCRSKASCSESDAKQTAPGTRGGPAFSALSCKGASASMAMATLALPAMSVVDLLLNPPVQAGIAIGDSRVLASRSLNPPSPPPRRHHT